MPGSVRLVAIAITAGVVARFARRDWRLLSLGLRAIFSRHRCRCLTHFLRSGFIFVNGQCTDDFALAFGWTGRKLGEFGSKDVHDFCKIGGG